MAQGNLKEQDKIPTEVERKVSAVPDGKHHARLHLSPRWRKHNRATNKVCLVTPGRNLHLEALKRDAPRQGHLLIMCSALCFTRQQKEVSWDPPRAPTTAGSGDDRRKVCMSVYVLGSLMIKGCGCAHGQKELLKERVTKHGPESAAGNSKGKPGHDSTGSLSWAS